ncbi:hypothetical protein [Afifella sp. YEN Y35]|uniref:hypothetical protein n=1 Tax=Afifella sp. YEN Y35 TaxID=3388337 RepID=UPI0039E01968
MKTADFRKELMAIMPGYRWTVHKGGSPARMAATGIQSSGFNRLSTLRVVRTEKDGRVWYETASSDYGARSGWEERYGDLTLARALRGLQHHYEMMQVKFGRLATSLQRGRKPDDNAVRR